MIIASAIKLENGDVFVGKRHGDCFKNYRDIMVKSKNGWTEDMLKTNCRRCEQGFITTELKFLTREQAAIHADTYRQIDRNVFDCLCSEDLW